MNINKCYYFEIEELVHPDILGSIGEEKCWELIPDVVKLFLDTTRYEYGRPIRINDYSIGGTYINSGVRRKDDTKYAKMSKHKNWNTFDLKDFGGNTARLHDFLRRESIRLNIERIEIFAFTKSWAHCEFGNTLIEKTTWFNP